MTIITSDEQQNEIDYRIFVQNTSADFLAALPKVDTPFVKLDEMIHIGDKMKPIIMCYSNQYVHAPGSSLHRYIERNLDAELISVSTWTDLVLAVTRKPAAIVFSCNAVDPVVGCLEFIEKIKRLCMRLPTRINIGVYVDGESSVEFINEMRKTDVVGIVPNPEQFGIDSSVEAFRCVLNGKSHWPNDIIACLPIITKSPSTKKVWKTARSSNQLSDTIPKLPNIVYFNDIPAQTNICTSLLSEKINCTWSILHNWQELTKALELGEKIIAIHIDMIDRSGTTVIEFSDMISTLLKFIPDSDKVKIGIVIKKNTKLKMVQELLRTNIRNILLDVADYSLDEVEQALLAFLNNTPYWPARIVSQLPGNKPTVNKKTGITLTERQAQIANLICKRGLSNKKVANMLNITESTVKAHVSAILKAYGVRNRTQLVVSATHESTV